MNITPVGRIAKVILTKDLKKQILFISSWFPNKLDPTAGNFVQRHAEAVAEFHDVEILHAVGCREQNQGYVLEDGTVNGIRTMIVYYRSTPYHFLNFIRRLRAYLKGFGKLRKPDLVHANVLHNSMFFAVYLKKRFAIPFVVTEHWTALRRINQKRTPLSIRKTAAFIGNQASKLLPVSEDLALGLLNLGITSPMQVIPNVVDMNIFHPGERNAGLFTFLHVSNLISRKNPDKILKVALELLAQGHQFRLQIGGDGDVSRLRDIAENSEFTDFIDVFGTQTGSEVAHRMRNADCFILFSDDENQPCVIGESFASGIRVISTNVGGISEFFPEGFGALLESVDEAQLSEAMLKMMSAADVSQAKMAAYARETFSRAVVGKKFCEVYDEVLS